MSRSSKILLAVSGFVLILWLLFRDLCIQFLFAGLISFLLRPIADWLQKKRGCRRMPAAILTMLLAAAVLLAVLFAAVPYFISQFEILRDKWDVYTGKIVALTDKAQMLLKRFGISVSSGSMLDASAVFNSLAEKLQSFLQKTASGITSVSFVLISCFYLLAEPDERYRNLLKSLPLTVLPYAEDLCRKTGRMVRQYFGSRVVMAVFVSVFCGICFWIAGLENAVIYAALLFFFDFIPYIGPLIGGLFPVISALSEGGVLYGAIILVVLAAAQQLEESVIGPRIQADAVGVHPLVGIFSLLACSRLFGVPGLFLAVPTAGFLKILYGVLKVPITSAQKIVLAEDTDKEL